MFLEFASEWCPSCNRIAGELDSFYTQLNEEDEFGEVVSVLYQNINPIELNMTRIPSVSELQRWRDTHSFNQVLTIADPEKTIRDQYYPGRSAEGGSVLIAPDGQIADVNTALGDVTQIKFRMTVHKRTHPKPPREPPGFDRYKTALSGCILRIPFVSPTHEPRNMASNLTNFGHSAHQSEDKFVG